MRIDPLLTRSPVTGAVRHVTDDLLAEVYLAPKSPEFDLTEAFGPGAPWSDSFAAAPEETTRAVEAAGGVEDNLTTSATDRGTAWHLTFWMLAQRPVLAGKLVAATGLPKCAIAKIAAPATAPTDWLASEGYDQLHFKLPLQEVSLDGSEINGILDCLAERQHGLLILDHKYGPCQDPSERFACYRPHLEANAAMVRRHWPDKPLKGIAVQWMSEGTQSFSTAPEDFFSGTTHQGYARKCKLTKKRSSTSSVAILKNNTGSMAAGL